MFTIARCLVIGVGLGLGLVLEFSVCSLSCYVHVCVLLLSICIVTLPLLVAAAWRTYRYVNLEGSLATISHRCCSGTDVQFRANDTIASTSSRP